VSRVHYFRLYPLIPLTLSLGADVISIFCGFWLGGGAG